MRMSGPILVISAMLAALFLVLYFLGGGGTGAVNPGGPNAIAGGSQDEHTIQELLSGDFKRTPKKNPDAGTGRLRCMVRDTTGLAVRGASVQVTPLDPDANILKPRPEYRHYWEASTDVHGVATFRTLPPGRFLLVASQGDLHALAQATAPASTAFGEASLVLCPVAPLRGEVRNSAGEAVEGAVVVPIHAPNWAGDAGIYRAIPVETDAGGAFVHPYLPPGDWQLLVSAEHFAPQLVLAREGAPASVRLDSGVEYAGRVLLEENERPLSNVKVLFQAEDAPGESYSARTNGQGVFTFERMRPASYRLSLDAPGHTGERMVALAGSGQRDVRPAPPESRHIRIDPLTGAAVATQASADPAAATESPALELPVLLARPAGSVRGRVVSGRSGTGVPGVEIVALRSGARAPAASAVSDQAGYYHIKPLSAGDYELAAVRGAERVFVAASGMLSVPGGQQVAGPEFTEVPAVSLSGQVLDEQGAPVAEANVTLEILGNAGFKTVHGADAEGNFHIGGLHAADQVRLRASMLGAVSPEFGPVTIGAAGLREIRLGLERP